MHDNQADVEHIDWRILERGVDAVLNRVDNSSRRIFTFDTRDQTDLEVIADAGLEMNAAMIGSSGLARAFPKERTSVRDLNVDSSIPTLYVVGSIHATSRAQKEELAQHGVPGVELLRRDIGNSRALDQIRDQAEHKLDAGETVYIATPDEVTSDAALWREIEDSMGHVSGIRSVRHNLVIVGGETARATLKGRDISSLEVRSEYEAGIPVSTEKDKTEAILTKAGGFGHANTLVDIHNYLQ